MADYGPELKSHANNIKTHTKYRHISFNYNLQPENTFFFNRKSKTSNHVGHEKHKLKFEKFFMHKYVKRTNH